MDRHRLNNERNKKLLNETIRSIEKKWKHDAEHPRQVVQDDLRAIRENNKEKLLHMDMAHMRRKRLDTAYKMILIEKLQEKQNR